MAKKDTVAGTQNHRMFVVDDEPGICRVLSQLFTHEGWTVLTFHNPVDALNALAETDVDVILSDLKMPQMTGIEFLQALPQRGSTVPLLVITAYGTIDTAVEAIKSGAFDYLCKPFELETVKLAVERALKQQKLQEEVAYLRQELAGRYEFSNIIG